MAVRNFAVRGPFSVPTAGPGDYKYIVAEHLERFWDVTVKTAGNGRGCYVFALSTSRGALLPIYVGRTSKRTFRTECFTPDKINKAQKGMRARTGKLVLFLVVYQSRPRAPRRRGRRARIRGVGLMEGYHRDPEATAAFFRNGWAHTGDLASRDAHGFIHLRGRRKEMIRRGGENIAPIEVETALATHPDVVECAVAPVPDDDMGEEAKAYVVRRDTSAVEAGELASYLAVRLASFKVPRYWEFRAALPHTPSERVAKHELERDRPDFRDNTVDLKA